MHDSSKKLIAKNTLILYFRLIITSIIGLISARFVIQGLGVNNFGLYSVVGSIVGVMALLNTVMSSTTYRFIAYELGRGDNNEVQKVFNISLAIHIVIAISVILLTELIGIFYINHYLNVKPELIPDARFVLRFSAYSVAFSILGVPYQGLLTAFEKFNIQAIFEIMRSILLMLAAIIIIYFDGNKLKLYSTLIAFAALIPTLLYLLYSRRNFPNLIKFKIESDKNKIREMINFSFWTVVGVTASLGQSNIIPIIINSFFGTKLNASFGITNSVNNIVGRFSGSINQAIVPQITKNYGGGNVERSATLAAYATKYSIYMIFLLTFPLFIETDYILKLWLGVIPPYAAIMCKLILINLMIMGLTTGLPPIIQASGKIKYFHIVISSINLLCIPLTYILFEWGYPPYIAIITFILTGIINVIIWQILLKLILNFNVNYFIKTVYVKTLPLLLILIPFYFTVNMYAESFDRFFANFVLVILLLLGTIYLFGFEQKEKILLQQFIRKIYLNRE